jgi:hypothetical protein
MADHTLCGNNDPCPACALQRESVIGQADAWGSVTDARHVHLPCQLCDGYGPLPLTEAEIVRRTVAAARRDYWPAREAAWAAEMGNVVPLRPPPGCVGR